MLRFYRRGEGKRIFLRHQRAGEKLDTALTNVIECRIETTQPSQTIKAVGMGDYCRYEATLELVGGWDESLEVNDYDLYSPLTNEGSAAAPAPGPSSDTTTISTEVAMRRGAERLIIGFSSSFALGKPPQHAVHWGEQRRCLERLTLEDERDLGFVDRVEAVFEAEGGIGYHFPDGQLGQALAQVREVSREDDPLVGVGRVG